MRSWKVESQNRQTSDWRAYAARTEGDTSRAHQSIRAALLSLPKETCPVGFEFRLMKKISSDPVRGGRRTSSNWMLGWAGAGLGVAVAMFVSFAAFDFNFSDTVPGNTAQTAKEIPTSTVIDQQPQIAVEKSTTINDNGKAVTEEAPVQLASTPEDSAEKIQRGEIPAGLDHTVSTNGGR
jgi:hypothetical protein